MDFLKNLFGGSVGKIGLGALLGLLVPTLLGRGKGGIQSLIGEDGKIDPRMLETNPDYEGKAGKVFVDRNTGQFFETPEEANRAQGGIVGLVDGGMLKGPGTGTSDSIPGMIYQRGVPVQRAALSNGEFVMTAKAVKGAGGGSEKKGSETLYNLMDQFERRA
jgi:hypothetical protein|tara:strand:- start:3149 stop:3634 length:486 start_codon:yes stop_codon:yes gene_type:complete